MSSGSAIGLKNVKPDEGLAPAQERNNHLQNGDIRYSISSKRVKAGGVAPFESVPTIKYHYQH